MQLMKSKGFRCKKDRAKDMELDKRYGSIGIKSVQAAQSLCSKSNIASLQKPVSHTSKTAN